MEGFVEVEVALDAGTQLELEFTLALAAEEPAPASQVRGHRRFAFGPLVLGLETAGSGAAERLPRTLDFAAEGRGRFRCRRTGAVLAPFHDLTYRSEAEARAHRTRLLFPWPEETPAER
jgi:DUF1680 family protein